MSIRPRTQVSPPWVRSFTVVMALLMAWPRPALAGGPIVVGGPSFGVEGAAFTWSTSTEVSYRTDGGTLGLLTNVQANTRVETLFQLWEDVPTANIGFNRLGAVQSVADGDVSTVAEFDAVEGDCLSNPPTQNPVVYDTDGTVFTGLGLDVDVIGFAGPCLVNSLGRIISGEVALNGKWIDGDGANGELTDGEFNGAISHEIGHLSGLDHSQINVNCLSACGTDDLIGLPTMFPVIFSGADEDPGAPVVNPAETLATDDLAWISFLYPQTSGATTFSGTHGRISGSVLFADGLSRAQGVNVIARPVGSPASRQNAVSVVSGFRFTSIPGQSFTATYLPCDSSHPDCPSSGFFADNTGGSDFGSRVATDLGLYRIPVPGGLSYTVEVEEIDPSFSGGSSVGPISPPFPLPGDPTSIPAVAVTNGAENSGNDVTVPRTPPFPRFDSFEGP